MEGGDGGGGGEEGVHRLAGPRLRGGVHAKQRQEAGSTSFKKTIFFKIMIGKCQSSGWTDKSTNSEKISNASAYLSWWAAKRRKRRGRISEFKLHHESMDT